MRNNQSQKGFTLLETLIAIMILTASISGIFTAVQKGLQTASYARDQVSAFYLTQEAVEFVRNIRDENLLKSQNWLTGLDTCMSPKKCAIDSLTRDICDISLSGCDSRIYYNAGTNLSGFKQSSVYVPTNFLRSVQLRPVQGTSDEVAIVVSIDWNSVLIQRNFVVRENLFNLPL
ncbi:type II secretion system GspH family protein [Candidatus Parcubacteria bacterium]|nr:type II secretion system GspH family protein [Candidatus Parcubacteria bacterium]